MTTELLSSGMTLFMVLGILLTATFITLLILLVVRLLKKTKLGKESMK
jgi:hypothetical protein